MIVHEVFHFGNGTTIFAGEVTEGPSTITHGNYELSVNGQLFGTIRIDGERSRGHAPNIRSVEISQELSFDSEKLKGREAYFANLDEV